MLQNNKNSLLGEKVDIYIMEETADWTVLSTEVTDKNGRVLYTISSDKAFGFGVYPVKMIVRYGNIIFMSNLKLLSEFLNSWLY